METNKFDWVCADNAVSPFCAVYEVESGDTVEEFPADAEGQAAAEKRARELNAA